MRQYVVLFSALVLVLSACGTVDVSIVTPPPVPSTDSAVDAPASLPQTADVTAGAGEPVAADAASSNGRDSLGDLYFFTMTLSSATGRANYPYQLMHLPGSCVVGIMECPQPELIVPPFPFGSSVTALSWSPDGSVAAFVYYDKAVMLYKLWFFDPATGTWTSRCESANIDGKLSWSPDGNWVAFVTMNEQGVSELYAIQRDGSDLKMLTSLSALPDMGYPYVMDGWFDGNVVLRPDWVEPGQHPSVYLVSLIDGVVQPMPEALTTGEHFTPSNNGAWLAYGEYNHESQVYTIFVAGPDGANPIVLTSFPSDTGGVPIIWSSDDNRLAFVQDDSGPGKGSTVQVNVINRDGTGLQEVCRPVDTAGGLMFSPDGKFLLTNEMGGSGPVFGRVFVVNLETLDEHILTAAGIVPEMGWFMTSWRR